jgi:LAO/AO transport system kinase
MSHIENDPKYKGLAVNNGVVQPPSINPYLQTQVKKKRKQYTVSEFVDGILKGDRVILSQAVTLLESAQPGHQIVAQEIIEKCLPYTGKSVRVGITGVPGAGKSTFIEALGVLLTKQEHQLAVLAIDPSSERSKGSILGDKTRMEELSRQSNAFIRPSPSAGSLGGVARKTRETIMLCEAAGFDIVFVETMGVGQSEIVVHSMVDFFFFFKVGG